MAPPAALRNTAVLAAVEVALRSDPRPLFTQLVRAGNLPGPRPNEELAAAFGEALAGRGPAADTLARTLASLDERQALGSSAEAFLPYTAAFVYVAFVAHDRNATDAWQRLYDLAGDARHVVRDGVVTALTRLVSVRASFADVLLEQMAHWTDGYLQAAVLVELAAQRPLLDALQDPLVLCTRLDEAWTLAVDAPRSAERSQGRRRLLEVFTTTLPAIAARQTVVDEWLTRAAATTHPDLRLMFAELLRLAARRGISASRLTTWRQAFDASAPPRRDPNSYRGPTRSRGKKR